MLDPLFLRRMLHAHQEKPPTRFDPPPRPPGPITLKDDAFHFKDYASSDGAFWYTEWWYFNFHDPVSGLDGMFTLDVVNPDDKYFLGITDLTAAVFVPGETKADPVIEYHSLKNWSASYEKADVRLGANSIEALGPTTYRIVAATQDDSIHFDLVYEQADQPQLLADNVHGNNEPWEMSSWLAYMPSARVSGTVRYRGKTYQLENAIGYHDHDWGMWHEYARTWSWAYVSNPDKKLSFDLGFHAAFQMSDAYFRYGDLRIIIPQANFTITQEEFVHWEVFWKYPTAMTFTAIDTTGQYKIDLAWRVTQTAVLWKYPVIVFEQTAKYTGTLQQKSGTGWQPLATIDDSGFCEYTSLWL